MLKIEKRKDHLYLGDIQLKEAFQRRGIGTSLIRDVMEKAKADGLPLRLRVLKENPWWNFISAWGLLNPKSSSIVTNLSGARKQSKQRMRQSRTAKLGCSVN